MNLAVHVDRGSAVSLQDQLFEQLRQLVLTGKLKPNSRVIGTRFLADQTGLSRTTVLLAYERLISEGYLETRPAVGTYVSSSPPGQPKPRPTVASTSAAPRQASLHPRALNASPLTWRVSPDSIVDFSPFRVDASHLLPEKVWLQGVRSVIERNPRELRKPQPAAGVLSLRQAIVDHLAATRGISASSDQVIIVTGRRQACSLIAHVFLRHGDRVVVEAPGDEEVIGFLTARDAQLIHVPVDEHGLETDRLPRTGATLAYVSPARQNPLGGTLPQARRAQLLDWARDVGAYIIEDDSGTAFRYHGTTPQPLAAVDPYGMVFYCGCFARTLGAGLGLGYLVAPAEFVDTITSIKSMAEEGGAWLEQMVVANLIASGGYDHHVRRVRKVLLERRDALIEALRAHFGDVQLIGVEIGAQLTWLLPDHFPSAQEVRDVAEAAGVHIEPVDFGSASAESVCRFRNRAVVLGYAASPPDRLRYGVARLAQGLQLKCKSAS